MSTRQTNGFNVENGKFILTVLEVIGFPDINADEGHELKLRESLSSRGGKRKKVSKIRDLRVDEISSELRCSFRRFVGIEAEKMGKRKSKMLECDGNMRESRCLPHKNRNRTSIIMERM
jgi:hypothetical protein